MHYFDFQIIPFRRTKAHITKCVFQPSVGIGSNTCVNECPFFVYRQARKQYVKCSCPCTIDDASNLRYDIVHFMEIVDKETETLKIVSKVVLKNVTVEEATKAGYPQSGTKDIFFRLRKDNFTKKE